MKIFLTNQNNRFKQFLEWLKNTEIMVYDKSNLVEKNNTIEINTNRKLAEINLDFLFDYNIFPDNIMSFKTQWSDENRQMKVGDTILQQAFIPPIKSISQKIIFGVRISEIIDRIDKKGFSYETLDGHVEKGISTFTIEQLDEKLIFKIQTYSTPGNILTKLLGTFFTVPYQTFCTKLALKNVKRQIEIETK